MDRIRKILHPVMKFAMKYLIRFPLIPFHVSPNPQTKPVIYCANHSNMHDIPIMGMLMPNQFFVLADDEPRGTIDGLMLECNGVVWVARQDKTSRRTSYESMKDHLRKGHCILIFPEAAWNIHECLPMRPLRWGIIELARECCCPIVPVTLEYPDFRSCYYSIGEPFYVDPAWDKAEAITRLRDVMTSMRWNFWESRGITSRAEIIQADYEVYTIDRFKEYQPVTWANDFEREKKNILHFYTTPEQAYSFMDHLIPCRENAFLFKSEKETT